MSILASRLDRGASVITVRAALAAGAARLWRCLRRLFAAAEATGDGLSEEPEYVFKTRNECSNGLERLTRAVLQEEVIYKR